VDEHGSLLTLELLQIAPALGATSDAVGDIALEILGRAVRTTLGESIAANLADLGERKTVSIGT
jgi:hypothetical protein